MRTRMIMLRAKQLFSFLLLLLFLITIECGGGGSGGSGDSGGKISLAWDAPTNVDGSPLTDLAGYLVCYGTSPGSYTQKIYVGNVTTYTLTSLTGGQMYYIAVTAIDTSNPPNESDYSNEVGDVLR